MYAKILLIGKIKYRIINFEVTLQKLYTDVDRYTTSITFRYSSFDIFKIQ